MAAKWGGSKGVNDGSTGIGGLVTHHKDIQSPLTERLIENGGSASVGVPPIVESDSVICVQLGLGYP